MRGIFGKLDPSPTRKGPGRESRHAKNPPGAKLARKAREHKAGAHR